MRAGRTQLVRRNPRLTERSDESRAARPTPFAHLPPLAADEGGRRGPYMKNSIDFTKLGHPDLIAIDRADASESFADFIRMSWHVLEPVQPLAWGWAMDAMAEHIEAVSYGDIRYLIMNVPPGLMKSLMTRVFFPAWEWGPRQMSWTKWIGTSYSDRLSRRDNRRARMLIESSWYQERWPLQLAGDQNAIERFENTDGLGFMISTSTKGTGTGERGHRIAIDDPNNVIKTESEPDREEVKFYLGEVLPSRTINEDTARILIQQRTHVDDATGFCLEAWPDPTHLCLPMEFETDRRCVVQVTGFRDPRTKEGELLFPERFGKNAVEELKKQMRAFGGTYAEAGQLQQSPTPRRGGVFQLDHFKIVEIIPSPIIQTIRYWDKAGTDGGGAYTAGVKMALLESGEFIVLDVIRRQFSQAKRESMIQATAESDGVPVHIWMEQEPGSGGKDSVILSIADLPEYTARRDRVNDGDKVQRAGPFAAAVEIGNVLILRGDWNDDYLKEHALFPAGKFKDQVDASSGAYNKLAKLKKRTGGVLGVAGSQEPNGLAALMG